MNEQTSSQSDNPQRGNWLPDRGHLLTEQRNEQSVMIDQGSTLDCLRIINEADRGIVDAIQAQIHQIAQFTNLVIESFRHSGRLVYLGAGTSGRLGVLDASECPPTFQSDPTQVIGLIAGGDSALRVSSEHKEDVRDGVREELEKLKINGHDTVLGIAAGGTTPYALGGIEIAKSMGARTGLLTCTPIDQPEWCDVLIAIETGSEVLTGSTRMKAGSATKMVLNMISTGAMVGIGKTYSNLMVDLRATNNKLVDRAIRTISQVCDLDREQSHELLIRAHNEVKPAIVMHFNACDYKDAAAQLKRVEGRLRTLLEDH